MMGRSYRLTPLEAPNSASTSAISEAGQVAGVALREDGRRQAVLWNNGGVVALGRVPRATSTEARGVNSQGRVVGVALGYRDTRYQALVWSSGAISLLPAGNGRSSASRINGHGEIVGSVLTGHGGRSALHRAVVWREGLVEHLQSLPGGGASRAWDISDTGLIAGVAQAGDGTDRTVLWRAGTICDLGAPDGQDSAAVAINAYGQVVGTVRTTTAGPHAFLRHRGALPDPATLPGTHASRAHDINDLGEIVGSATRLSNQGACHHAVIWRCGEAIDLNGLLGPATDAFLGHATGISNHGHTAGTGMIEGRTYAFLLTPTG